MGSDAHIDLDVGAHEYSQKLLAAAEFPEALVINSDVTKFKEYIGK